VNDDEIDLLRLINFKSNTKLENILKKSLIFYQTLLSSLELLRPFPREYWDYYQQIYSWEWEASFSLSSTGARWFHTL